MIKMKTIPNFMAHTYAATAAHVCATLFHIKPHVTYTFILSIY